MASHAHKYWNTATCTRHSTQVRTRKLAMYMVVRNVQVRWGQRESMTDSGRGSSSNDFFLDLFAHVKIKTQFWYPDQLWYS
jgi:hypothetical protein